MYHLREWKQYKLNILKKRSDNGQNNENNNLYYKYRNKHAKTIEYIQKMCS